MSLRWRSREGYSKRIYEKRGVAGRAGFYALQIGSRGRDRQARRAGACTASDLKLDIAFWNYDRTRAPADGTIKIDGVDASFHSARIVPEIFEQMIRQRAFDVSELGTTYFLRAREVSPEFLAIPVFPNRAFRTRRSISTKPAGTYNSNTGVYSFTGSAAAATTALNGLVFDAIPNRIAPGTTEITTFTIVANDGVGPVATNSTTMVFTTSVNDAPLVYYGVAVAGQTTGDNQPNHPFPALRMADVDNPA